MAKKKKQKKRKTLTNIKRALKIVSGIALTVSMLFLAGFSIDTFVRKDYQTCSKKKFSLFSEKENLKDDTDGIQLEKISPDSYQSFFKTLLQKEEKNERIDRQREKDLFSTNRFIRKKTTVRSDSIKVSESKTKKKSGSIATKGVIYQIQVGSFHEMERATAFAEKLAEKGYNPSVNNFRIPGKGQVFRVRIGKYKKIEQAQETAEELQKREKITAFITSR
jgi:SPOR domain